MQVLPKPITLIIKRQFDEKRTCCISVKFGGEDNSLDKKPHNPHLGCPGFNRILFLDHTLTMTLA